MQAAAFVALAVILLPLLTFAAVQSSFPLIPTGWLVLISVCYSRMIFAAVVTEPDGVTVRHVLRTYLYSWSGIERFELADYGASCVKLHDGKGQGYLRDSAVATGEGAHRSQSRPGDDR